MSGPAAITFSGDLWRWPVLAGLLLIGSVSGAQIGAQFAQKASPVRLRLVLAVIVLLVALRMAIGLTYRPDEIYTLAPL